MANELLFLIAGVISKYVFCTVLFELTAFRQKIKNDQQ